MQASSCHLGATYEAAAVGVGPGINPLYYYHFWLSGVDHLICNSVSFSASRTETKYINVRLLFW